MTRIEKNLLILNIAIYSAFTTFSYSYVDLNLTLSQNPLSLRLVSFLQQLGYFNRPIATLTYIILLTLAFSFFMLNLKLFKKSKVSLQYLKISTIANTLILVFAYPFLSADIFNYIFDAKIILNYHLSPYSYRPLDFPNDDWLRFMRWIHRYSPYGPLWLSFSLIPFLLGFGKFIITLFSFKIFVSLFHLINSFIIYKILQKTQPSNAVLGTAFYSLNPLFLIEGVANSHNDVVLTTFLLLPILTVIYKKRLLTLISITAGTLIKYIPILNLPWFLLSIFNKSISLSQLIYLNLASMVIFTIAFSSFSISVPFVSSGSTQVQFQPWYLFWTLPFIALTTNQKLISIAITLAVGASLRYLPYLYYGDWSNPITLNFMRIVTIAPALALASYYLLKRATRVFNEET